MEGCREGLGQGPRWHQRVNSRKSTFQRHRIRTRFWEINIKELYWHISQFRKGDVCSRDFGALGGKILNFYLLLLYTMVHKNRVLLKWAYQQKGGVCNALNISEWGGVMRKQLWGQPLWSANYLGRVGSEHGLCSPVGLSSKPSPSLISWVDTWKSFLCF